MFNSTLVIIFLLIILLVIISNHKCSLREGMKFESNFLKDAYKNNGIQIDENKEILKKNGEKLSYKNHFNKREGRIKCSDKSIAHDILKKNYIPVANNYVWDFEIPITENIKRKKIKYPVVAKPTNGQEGKMVTTKIDSNDKLTEVAQEFVNLNQPFLLEEQIFGKEYRIMILNDEIIGITERQKPIVTGDGINNIYDLIDMENQKRRNYVKIHDIDDNLLSKQGYSLDSIPKKNEEITISSVPLLTNGGSMKNININSVHPDNIEMFKKINKVLGVNLTGIDYISPTIYNSYNSFPENTAVIDVNSKPAFTGILEGQTQNNKSNIINRFVSSIFQ